MPTDWLADVALLDVTRGGSSAAFAEPKRAPVAAAFVGALWRGAGLGLSFDPSRAGPRLSRTDDPAQASTSSPMSACSTVARSSASAVKGTGRRGRRRRRQIQRKVGSAKARSRRRDNSAAVRRLLG